MGLCSRLLDSGFAMGKILYWTAHHRLYNQWRSQIGMTIWSSFSVFLLFLGRGQLASLIESLKLAEKNLTLVFHPTRCSGWNYSGFYTHHPAEMTQQETWAAMVRLHWHQMYFLGYELDKTLAPLLEPETLLDRKCPNVSIAICSTAPTFLLPPDQLEQSSSDSEGNLPFLASPEQFSPADRCSLEISNETPHSIWPCLA